MYPVRKQHYLAIALIFGLAGCGDGTTTDTTTDTTPPTVTSTSPASGATGVARNTVITGTFSEDMLATSIGTSSVTLAGVSGTVVLDVTNEIVTFTPNSGLGLLTNYTATLSTDIADLSGNKLATPKIWSFTTADGAWGTAAPIETESLGDAYRTEIVFDSSGNAIAVWGQNDGTRYNIWTNRFNGTSWGTAALIETDDSGHASTPKIAIDSSGNAIAVWFQSDGTRYNIWTNRFNGTSWGTAALIETDDSGDAEHPEIVFDSSGNAIAVWFQNDGTRSNIWTNRFNGTSWGTAALIETDDSGYAGHPEIAIDSSGNAIAVWHQSDGARFGIWTNRFNGTSWGTAALIETDDSGDAYRPEIAIDSSGNAIAVWSQSDGTRNNIWANRFNGTSWGTAALIETDDSGDAYRPEIAIDSSGNAIAVWHQSDGTRFNMWTNRFNGTSWGTAALIETDNSGNALSPEIAIDSSGNAIAVWHQSDGTRNNIWANRFNGTSWGTAALIETDDSGDTNSPQIAIDSSGNAIAVWTQSDGSFLNVLANRFQ